MKTQKKVDLQEIRRRYSSKKYRNEAFFAECNRMKLLHEEIDKDLKYLTEINLEDIGHLALDIAGLIPGIGEAADLTNALWYSKKGQYLMAGFSIVSMIPGIGDLFGKGGKGLALLAKGGGKLGPKAAKHLSTVAKAIKPHIPKITKWLKSQAEDPDSRLNKHAGRIAGEMKNFAEKNWDKATKRIEKGGKPGKKEGDKVKTILAQLEGGLRKSKLPDSAEKREESAQEDQSEAESTDEKTSKEDRSPTDNPNAAVDVYNHKGWLETLGPVTWS
jgi:hypothetical protein